MAMANEVIRNAINLKARELSSQELAGFTTITLRIGTRPSE